MAPVETRNDRIPEDHLQELLDKVARDLRFKSPRYDVCLGSKPGDNYASLIYRVEIREDGRKLSVMVKSAHQNKALRESANFYIAFSNEVNFYNLIFPFYVKLMRERGLLAEDEYYPNSPRCYLAQAGGGQHQERDALVLQDMRPAGYVMCDRTRGMDEAHCRVVLRALAHLHAASFAAELQHPEDFARLRGSLTELFAEGSSAVKIFDPEKLTPRVLNMIRDRFPEGTAEYQKAKRIMQVIWDELRKVVHPSSDGGNAITYGDCWTNNLLFKYSEDTGKVQQVCLLDFQIARYASPVLDLSYFLFPNTERAMRRQHLDSMLREYHRELQARMRVLGVPDPDGVFSWHRLQDHLKRFARYGLYLSVIVIPLFLADQDEVPDFKTRVEDGCDLVEALEVNAKDSFDIDRRFSDVLEEMFERGYV